MGRVLIIGNKGDRLSQLKENIEGMGHSVITVDFDNAPSVLHTKKPNLALVDLTTVRRVVESWQELRPDIEDSHTSAIVLIPQDRVRDVALLKGISDFALHPCNAHELETRIKLILMKQENISTGETIKVGNIVINPAKYEVTVDGWPIVLTLKEYELLKYLATHRGRVFTRDVLLERIWGYNYYGGTRTVDVHIGRLRTKIETKGNSFIRTVRGVGYMFTDEKD